MSSDVYSTSQRDCASVEEKNLTKIAAGRIALIPARFAAKRRAVEAAIVEGRVLDEASIRRERKRLNQRDRRAKQPRKESSFKIAQATPDSASMKLRLEMVREWLGTSGKRQEQLLAGGKDAATVAKEITALWIRYQSYVGKHGHAPGQTDFGLALGISPSQAQSRLKLLAAMEAEGGPWAADKMEAKALGPEIEAEIEAEPAPAPMPDADEQPDWRAVVEVLDTLDLDEIEGIKRGS